MVKRSEATIDSAPSEATIDSAPIAAAEISKDTAIAAPNLDAKCTYLT